MNTSSQKIGPIQIGIIVLTVATAFIHLLLAIAMPDPMFTPLFLMNGIGYLVLLAALFLPQLARFRSAARWLLMAFAAATIIGYFVVNKPADYSPIGFVTKAIEAVLIVLLFLDRNR